jgi:subfamily B ATP-binding cassette protein HlyB/CyaB
VARVFHGAAPRERPVVLLTSSTINIWDEVKSFETVMGVLSGTPFQQSILQEMGKSLVLCQALQQHGLGTPLPDAERQPLLSAFCQQQPLPDEAALATWLKQQQKSRAQLLDALDYTERIERLKAEVISEQAINDRFVAQKAKFDSVIFSLLRTDNESQAWDWYRQLCDGGQDFATLAKAQSMGPEAAFGGLVGPRRLSELKPELRAKLVTLAPNQTSEPFSLDGTHTLVVRLQRLDVAQLSHDLSLSLRNELFEQWLDQQVRLSGIRLTPPPPPNTPNTAPGLLSAAASELDTLVIPATPKIHDDLVQSSDGSPLGLGWYLKQLLRAPHLTLQMVASSALVEVFALGLPIFYMVIFDRVFGRQNLSTLNVMAVGMLLIVLADVLVKQLRAYVLAHQLEAVDKRTVAALLQKVMSLPLSAWSRETMQGFSERYPELLRLNQVMVSTILTASLDAVFSVLLVGLLFILSPPLAAISLCPMVPMAILSLWSAPTVRRRATALATQQRRDQIKLSEYLQNLETVHAARAEGAFQARLYQQMTQGFAQNFSARFDRLSGPQGQGFITSLGGVVTLYFGALLVLEGHISFGTYMAVNMLSRVVLGTLQRLLQNLVQLQEVKDTRHHCQTLLANTGITATESEDTGVRLTTVRGQWVAQDLSFAYPSQGAGEGRKVLQGVSFEIQPGEKVILTGQSGAGKTTLIRLMQRLYTPTAGALALDGVNVVHWHVATLRQQVGVALQKPAIFSGTLRENLLLANPQASTQTLLDVVSLVDLDELLAQLPQGFDSPLAPMGANISGGQLAKIALARTLLQQPAVLILDEALAALSESSAATIVARLLDRYAHQTCLWVTNHTALHHQADRILVLHDGHVAEDGTASQLLRAQGYYYHLHPPVPMAMAGVV